MKNKVMRLASKLTAASMVLSMFASVMPAGAAVYPTEISDTMDRLAANATGVTHVLAFSASEATSDWANTETIIFDYSTAGFSALSETVECSITGTGSCTGDIVSDDVVLTCNDAAGCQGAVSYSFTATNPSAGSTTVNLLAVGTSEYEGLFNLMIVDSDQVTITANIDPTLLFDLDVSLTDGESASPYAVDLGGLSANAVSSSNNTTIPSIWVDIETNATSGAVVTVQNAGNGGLQSTSTPIDIIGVVTGSDTLVAGTEGYGICVTSTTESAGATLTAAGNFSTEASCTPTSHLVGNLGSAVANILTLDDPSDGGRAEILVKAAVSTATPAHPDYTDTLTFIATATF